jgi:hypothetical protein
MSYISEQLSAPAGYGPLRKDCVYHYIGRGGKGKAYFTHFDEKPGVYLITMPVTDFEAGLDDKNKRIVPVPAEAQVKVPPWLARLAGKNLSTLDKLRRKSKSPKVKTTLAMRVDQRVAKIQPLVSAVKSIFAADDPEAEINRLARNAKPALNEARARLWVLTYLSFGRNKWVLLPAYCNVGTWLRENCEVPDPDAPQTKTKGIGYRMTNAMSATCNVGYHKFAKRSVFMPEIWDQTLTKFFGCKRRTLKHGLMEFYHPQGKPFPSFWQFYRAIIKKHGRRAVQIKLHGAARIHRTRAASKGKFSEDVANLLERVEADAYYLKEVPKGPIDGEPMPPLCVVRIRCVTSGMIVGIGFCLGKERSAAYRMALFSMAVPKDEFCAFFGEKVSRELWPCIGLPSWAVVDRGPGASADLIKEFEARIPIRELAPSWSGQSKATVESSHPRDSKTEGQPTYIQSDLNYVELARREIRRTIADNQRIFSEARQVPKMVLAKTAPTPLAIWNYLEARMRTDAHPMPFDQAVRNFLEPIKFTAKEDGVYLEGQRFDSDALRATGLHDRVVTKGHAEIPGYVLSLSVRQAWVEPYSEIIRVDALLALRDSETQLYMSLRELQDVERLRAKMRTRFQEHRQAVNAEEREIFESETGKHWHAGRRRSGRAKRGGAAARAEFSAVRKATSDQARRS